ncbi:hypothetical protein H7347_09650 [Corynebacterium sp. zg-331]|uniref:hypothetical protein n=1 Tax=unclassified Corynebacterium TaxID=2624378 RepID=UPI00128B9987|nr:MULTISPECIES: hypothetical protein [unclassified Corynebacterium]MBC3186824.1 hypothetical protein [Corynebacterium sp. zg-331]MPV53304.1 hypothetical protein [Corynebacterium sp. zg331]
MAGAINNVYVARQFARSLGDGGVEVAAKLERAWEFIQAAGYCARGRDGVCGAGDGAEPGAAGLRAIDGVLCAEKRAGAVE